MPLVSGKMADIISARQGITMGYRPGPAHALNKGSFGMRLKNAIANLGLLCTGFNLTFRNL